ncbi:hypothetical protein V1515DRAFT_594200 [Lipomyces mesembrius]
MSKLHQRSGAASERDHPAGTPLDGYGSASSSTTALDHSSIVSESEPMNMAGNDSGWPLIIHYEKWSTLYRSMPNMLLDNKGPVARDHLANERTYLSWTRTSLSFATIGLAVTSAFRGYGDGILIVGKIFGALFIILAIALMIIGTYRYYITAIWLQRGKFPPGRASILNITIVACSLIAIAFILIVINTSRAPSEEPEVEFSQN